MGASQFTATASGPSAGEAFRDAVDLAKYEYGHGGYTGTIAEKDSFVLVSTEVLPDADAAETLADRLLEADDPRVTDKGGPAGAVEYRAAQHAEGERAFLFFGFAPS